MYRNCREKLLFNHVWKLGATAPFNNVLSLRLTAKLVILFHPAATLYCNRHLKAKTIKLILRLQKQGSS